MVDARGRRRHVPAQHPPRVEGVVDVSILAVNPFFSQHWSSRTVFLWCGDFGKFPKV